VHAVAAVQETPLNRLLVAPDGVGTTTVAQLLPFHRSASARVGLTAGLVAKLPTAVQALAELHDTPDSMLLVAPDGFGVDWTAHLVPLQRSANVCCAPWASMK
jgi:hypothetical protein